VIPSLVAGVRRRAYFKVREVVESIKPGKTLIDSVLRDPELSSMFNREELIEFLNPSYATRSVRGIVERTLRYVEELLNK